tara:strand:+ start:664 stop:1869 length:1206 start_codon:yes stop_codon:yes gene_type:complete
MSRLTQANQVVTPSVRKKVLIGIVIDVVTNDEHPIITEPAKTFLVGAAKIRRVDDTSSSPNQLRYYQPHDHSNLDLPIVGETVELIERNNATIVYRRIGNNQPNSGNFTPKVDKVVNPFNDDSETGGDYAASSQTGTPSSSGGGGDSEFKNEYFESTQVNPLNLYEGDKIIQGRFGQSIRFSGYNNVDNVLAPTIIIRNRQGQKSLDETQGEPTKPIYENIIDDGSTIVLTSGEHLLEFTPGTIDTPLETEPIYAEEPELKGTDQVLINSGRIILSSKDSEMLFYSKGNYSFISDGKLTIDNGLDGAEIDLNGEYRTTTNDNNMYFLGGTGEIYLNTEETTEPLVRGETLKGLMEQLIDAINAQVFSTPCGPTAVGPNNRGDFNKIKSKLVEFLSTLNYTE